VLSVVNGVAARGSVEGVTLRTFADSACRWQLCRALPPGQRRRDRPHQRRLRRDGFVLDFPKRAPSCRSRSKCRRSRMAARPYALPGQLRRRRQGDRHRAPCGDRDNAAFVTTVSDIWSLSTMADITWVILQDQGDGDPSRPDPHHARHGREADAFT
jgi:hypothetical protein